nr:carbohydrate-binding domain-containing protein [Bacillus sp. MRMR6]
MNVGGGNDGSGMDMSTSSAGLLQISGGTITVNASGDGLDSNGSIAMTGGTVMVNGPTISNNGALDYDGSFDISGGLIIAVGSSGMVQTSSDQSAQASSLMTYPTTQAAGLMVHLEDHNGKNIISFLPANEYQSVFISSPELKKDSSYTLYSGGSSTGSNEVGLYKNGEYKGGTKIVNLKWLLG